MKNFSILEKQFGETTLYKLINNSNSESVSITQFASSIESLMLKFHSGLNNIIFSHSSFEELKAKPFIGGASFLSVAGRVPNAKATVNLPGKKENYRLPFTKDTNYFIHGFAGMSEFELVKEKSGVFDDCCVLTLRYVTDKRYKEYPSGIEMVTSNILSEGKFEERVLITNKSDKVVPVAAGRHASFCLSSGGATLIDNWLLKLNAREKLELDGNKLFTGKMLSLNENDKFNFNKIHSLSNLEMDTIYMIDGNEYSREAAVLYNPENKIGIKLSVAKQVNNLVVWTNDMGPSKLSRQFVALEPCCNIGASFSNPEIIKQTVLYPQESLSYWWNVEGVQ